jgi:predicted enzyme related to lactoylglutathione lyase
MGQPVVHFEVMGTDAAKLQKYYADLFDWKVNVFPGSPINYGLVEGAGIGGGIGGSADVPNHVTFYVEVPDVEAALKQAEGLGGTRLLGPDQVPGGPVIGLFNDPEGNTVGVTQTAS